MVPANSSLAEEDQAVFSIPPGVPKISKVKNAVFAEPVLSNLYLDFID
jgi:hypothetical protein